MASKTSGSTSLGKIISLLLIAGLIGLGVYILVFNKSDPGAPAGSASGQASVSAPTPTGTGAEPGGAEEVVETKTTVPVLPPPAPYEPRDKTLDIELSEYAGYAGLVVANGGLAPNEASPLFKKHGVKLKLALSESEDWGRLTTGKLAASATTVDVLAVYGRSLGSVVPAQIGFSRGADGVLVRSEIKRINELKGRIVATSQLNEADFFIRFLAKEAGLEINAMSDLKAPPEPGKINLIFCEDAAQAGALFLRDVQSGSTLIAGAVSWAPFTTEVVEKSNGKARLLVTNRNLLIIADVLLVNKGLADQHPELVAALVDGLLTGNRAVRDDPAAHVDTIAKAFKWDRDKTLKELQKVHLANLPENKAFFSGAIDAAGSFGGIYHSAVFAYGDLIKNAAPPEKLLDLRHLDALEKSGDYKDQRIAIAPIKTKSGGTLEVDPLLSKDIRFYFEPNSSKLDLSGENKAGNEENLAAIKKLLQVSPGSTVLLRGHVDDSLVAKFRQQGGETLVQKMALGALQLSKDRAAEIQRLLIEKHKIDAKRLETHGVGWNEPISKTDTDLNRRVEVQWFTLE
jgi:NitT/TauT family transport system substrate-binding protein